MAPQVPASVLRGCEALQAGPQKCIFIVYDGIEYMVYGIEYMVYGIECI